MTSRRRDRIERLHREMQALIDQEDDESGLQPIYRAAEMTSRRSVLQSRPLFLAHTQFAQCVDPVHQTHKTFVSSFFEEGRRVFDRSNAASLAQLMATPDRPGSLFNLFKCISLQKACF